MGEKVQKEWVCQWWPHCSFQVYPKQYLGHTYTNIFIVYLYSKCHWVSWFYLTRHNSTPGFACSLRIQRRQQRKEGSPWASPRVPRVVTSFWKCWCVHTLRPRKSIDAEVIQLKDVTQKVPYPSAPVCNAITNEWVCQLKHRQHSSSGFALKTNKTLLSHQDTRDPLHRKERVNTMKTHNKTELEITFLIPWVGGGALDGFLFASGENRPALLETLTSTHS